MLHIGLFRKRTSKDSRQWNRQEGSRRVDFIFYHPKIDAIAIEIDGDEHEANEAVDLERDNSKKCWDRCYQNKK